MNKLKNRIKSLENVVFTLLIDMNKAECCQTCGEQASNYKENELIEDTGACNDCYDNEYSEENL